jgi:xylulokinase
MTLVAGIDSSTQSTKVEIRDVGTGRTVAVGRSAHRLSGGPPVSEQDPAMWWDALIDAFGQVSGHLADVGALSVAGQQHGLVVLDAADAVIRPARLWNDTTSAPQAAALTERFGARAWAEASGLVPVASFTITKLAWLAEHEPANLERVRRVMLPHDYLTWRLTGVHATDRGDASGTGWWDPTSGTYRADLLGLVVPDPDAWLERLPAVLGPTDPAGPILPQVAAALGLPRDVIVGPGTGDNMAAALGLGLGPGDVAMSLGTSGTVFAVSTQRTVDPTGAVAGFADATGRFLPLVATLNATRVTDAVAGWLGVDRVELARLAFAGPVRDDLVLVPYLDGERSPNLPDATGVWSGLRTATTREEIAASAHLGVVCSLLEGVDALRAVGLEGGGNLTLVGGGARSPAYRQLLADAWGESIRVPEAEESVATGAGVQAAAVLGGEGPDVVAERWGLGAGLTVEPRPDTRPAAIRSAYRRAAGLVARAAAEPRA